MNYRKYITDNPRVAYLLVYSVGMLLRLLLIGAKSLWVDEAYAAGLMEMNPMDLIRMSIAGSPHPPLAFLFLKFSTLLFGQGEVGLRLVPAVASALAAVPLMLLIARRINLSSALWAGLIWAVSPFAVSLGQEAWLYGIVSFLGFLFIDIADRAWNGSRKALYFIVPIALIGMLLQHMFGLFVAAGFALYFTVPLKERLPWRQLALVSIIFAVLYSPFAVLMLEQASFRADRISRAAMDMAAVYRYRLLVRIPTVFVRLIPGGLLLESGRGMLHDTKQIIFWLTFGAGNLFLLFNLFLRNLLDRKFRIWLLFLFAVPFLIFLKEDPTVRHLTILWIPLGFAIAAASRKWKYAGPIMLAAAAIMLLPYYNIRSFPYHRSDWRGAAVYVEERFSDGESVLVLGGQSGGLAWDYYSSGSFPRAALGGEDPYRNSIVPGRSAQSAVDSLLNLHDSIWLVKDYWGGPKTSDVIRGYRVLSEIWISPAMEVIHISK
ncbi:MAG: glycosyltransferase family 39 protein [Candidatus Aegiribacteria sp.]|nr:glycosyltransferase family 39 protein [Candidatus Aegiribacteria sp.]